MPLLRALAEHVEDDVRPYVRAAKDQFRRLRPYEIEPRLEPCIDNVRGDLSYPSGHANYGYVMAYLLRDMVPERGHQLMARADEFARQRMVCGVHFRSDLEAGRKGALWLIAALNGNPAYREDWNAARAELRNALNLPPRIAATASSQPAVRPALIRSARTRRTASRLRRSFRRAAHVCPRPSAATLRTCAAARAVRR